MKNKKGEAIFIRKGINKCASKFCENLYVQGSPHSVQSSAALLKTKLMVEVIGRVVKELKNNKTTGTDSLCNEQIKKR